MTTENMHNLYIFRVFFSFCFIEREFYHILRLASSSQTCLSPHPEYWIIGMDCHTTLCIFELEKKLFHFFLVVSS